MIDCFKFNSFLDVFSGFVVIFDHKIPLSDDIMDLFMLLLQRIPAVNGSAAGTNFTINMVYLFITRAPGNMGARSFI